MNRIRIATTWICPLLFAALLGGFGESANAATPVSGTFYWTNFGAANAYGYGSFSWDGVSLSATTTQLGPLAGFSVDGSLVVASDGNIYSGRAGGMSKIDPSTGAVVTFSTGVNNNSTSLDPPRTTIYSGWKDTSLATQSIANFGPGTPHSITGSETVATALAWQNNGTVWYTTGGENVLGNVGTINLSTFVTVRKLTAISATSIIFDPATGYLFTAGINGIAQIDPASSTVVSTWANPQGGGSTHIQNLAVTGLGHLVALDDNGLLRIWDLSSGSHLIGAPDTIQASFPTAVMTGGMALATLPLFPLITSPLNARGIAGRAFTYQLETQNATTKTATNLPAGLTFNSALSAITGTPNASGTFQVNLSATKGSVTTTATLTLTIQAPPTSGPTILSSTAATGRTGVPFDFQVFTRGTDSSARITADALPAGLTIDSITGLISGTPAVSGSFAVTLTLTSGGTVVSAILQLTFTSDSALPVILSSKSATLTPGQPFSYTIDATCTAPPSDPTAYDLIGTLPAGLTFDRVTGVISGTPAAAFRADDSPASPQAPNLSGGVITNVQLFATNSHGTATTQFIFYLAPTGAVNIATRLAVGTGNNVLIAGFIITGNAPKKVVLRAIGPSLSSFFSGVVQDPTLELYPQGGALLAENDNWRATQENEIIASTIAPRDDLESAMLAILNPGSYTAIVRGKNNTTGVAVVEVYDLGTASLDVSSTAKLAQISTRGTVQSGDSVMIGGFILSGPSSKVIVRAIGPSLNAFLPGALQDTLLELRNGSGALVAENDDWRSSQEQAIRDTTVPPSDDREAAIVATLPPGNYTGIVRGKGNATGVALVEVYGLN